MTRLRCKAGDHAIIVKSTAGNEGRIVRCVRFVGGSAADRIANDINALNPKIMAIPPVADDFWEVDQLMNFAVDGEVIRNASPFSNDSRMIPLLDTDEEDEMIRIAGKPEEALNER